MLVLRTIYSDSSLKIQTWAILSLQDTASPLIEELIYFHDFTITIITLILALVGLNLFFICYYKLTDQFLLQNQTVEMLWTVLPIFILILIATPSLKALYLLDDPFSPSLTIKTVGHQWYWSYEYSDFEDLEFRSYIVPQLDLKDSDLRLLETDNNVVLPIHTQVRVIVTATDVLHSWTVPSLGVKVDAVPGRLNQLMVLINRPGIFYGQCSEICGANHRFIPIKIEAVPMNIFSNWVRTNLFGGWIISANLLNLL